MLEGGISSQAPGPEYVPSPLDSEAFQEAYIKHW